MKIVCALAALFADVLATPNDISIYPLVLEYIKFNISTEIEKMDHVVDIKNLKFIYDEMIVEIEDVVNNQFLMVYPNPATDYIVVVNASDKLVQIYDMKGALMLESNHEMINVETLHSGTYIVKQGANSCKIIIK